MKRVWFLHCYLEFDMFFQEEATFSLLLVRPSTKAFCNAFNIGLNYATNYKAGLKQGMEGSGRN